MSAPRIAALAVAAAAMPCLAQVHLCTGADGRKTYSDRPCGDDAKVIDVRPAAGGTGINPATSMTNVYFDVRGVTYAELMREIGTLGPHGGRWGMAGTRIQYKLQARQDPQGCAVADVSVSADSRVWLPRWTNRHEAPRDVQERWDGAYRSVELHERGHVQISLESARELERRIRQIPPAASCEALKAQAQRTWEEVYRRERERQVRYDRETEHGIKQWSPYGPIH